MKQQKLDLPPGMQVSAYILRTLRKNHCEHMNKLVTAGHKLVRYKCPTCKKHGETRCPPVEIFGDDGQYASTLVCMYCGRPNEVVVHVSGKTEAVPA